MEDVLLVEDNAVHAELIRSAFDTSQLESKVVVMSDSDEAIAYLEKKQKDKISCCQMLKLVLLDIQLQEGRGVNVLKHIKESDKFCGVPVVVFTSLCQKGDVECCYKMGANAFVVKPTEEEALVDVVKKMGMFWVGLNEQVLE